MDTNAIQKNEPSKKRLFLKDTLSGAAIGTAFIIPGFSGGSIAAILGIYEKLIEAISDIFKTPKKSIMTLLPIGIGMVLGIMALLFPLEFFLGKFPLPTVSLFVGLALGGMPSITDKAKGKPSFYQILSLVFALLVAGGMMFLPIASDVNLLDISFGGYVILFLVGILGSSALVVPGISGSMILLILGYYNPIVNLITNHILRGDDILKSMLAIGSCALGILLGFIFISFIMKNLLKKYPKSTYYAIIGVIIGSSPTVVVSTAKEAGMGFITLPKAPLHWIFCVLLFAVGSAISYLLVMLSRKKNACE